MNWIATDYSKIVINNFQIQINVQICAGIGIHFIIKFDEMNVSFFFFQKFKFVDLKVHKSILGNIFESTCIDFLIILYVLYQIYIYIIQGMQNCAQNYFSKKSFCFVIHVHLFCIFNCNMSKVHKKTLTLFVVDKLCYHRFC